MQSINRNRAYNIEKALDNLTGTGLPKEVIISLLPPTSCLHCTPEPSEQQLEEARAASADKNLVKTYVIDYPDFVPCRHCLSTPRREPEAKDSIDLNALSAEQRVKVLQLLGLNNEPNSP